MKLFILTLISSFLLVSCYQNYNVNISVVAAYYTGPSSSPHFVYSYSGNNDPSSFSGPNFSKLIVVPPYSTMLSAGSAINVTVNTSIDLGYSQRGDTETSGTELNYLFDGNQITVIPLYNALYVNPPSSDLNKYQIKLLNGPTNTYTTEQQIYSSSTINVISLPVNKESFPNNSSAPQYITDDLYIQITNTVTSVTKYLISDGSFTNSFQAFNPGIVKFSPGTTVNLSSYAINY